MFKFVLLLLSLSGLRAFPISDLHQRSPSIFRDDNVPDFREDAELSRGLLGDLNTNLVKDYIIEDRRVVPADGPAQRNGVGWVRVEDGSVSHLPDGFRQGTEPRMSIPDGFRQGTEPRMSIPDGFKQGTEPSFRVPDGFRQGTEPRMSIPDGFKQGTEPSFRVPDGFRQGTEPSFRVPDGFRQGTEPSFRIPDAFRQGTEPIPAAVPFGSRQKSEPSAARIPPQSEACEGELINGNCYEFNPTPLSFHEAQTSCRSLAPKAELASVTSGDLHTRLVFLATKGGKNNPVLTWLGATVKNQQASWVDGSEWSYSDWMPGHPNVHTDKPTCVEMFRIDESWWTVADCDLKRASICSFPITA